MPRLAVLSILMLGLAAGASHAQEFSSLSALLRGTHVHGLAFDPKDENRILLATHHGLHALDLATGEVAPIGASRQDFMGFSVDKNGDFFASGHPEAGGNSGVLLSSDSGVSWTTLSEGADGPVDFHQMTVSPADPATLYGAYAGRLQRSRDGGATWELVAPVPEGLIDLAASSVDPDRLFAATEAGLLVSEDGGAGWQPAGRWSVPISFVETGPGPVVNAFVLGEGLVRAQEGSLDDWAVVSEPIGGDYLLHFATDGTRAAAVTGLGALLYSEDNGETWRIAGG